MNSNPSAKIIKAYLEKHQLTIREFAKHCYFHYTTIHRWLNGKNNVSKKNARWIESRTKGAIKAKDLL